MSCVHEPVWICGIYMEFRGMFVAGTYMIITCEVYIAVGCVQVHIDKSVEFIHPRSIMVLWLILVVWQPCMSSGIKYVQSDLEVEIWYTGMQAGLHTCIQ